MAIIFGYFYVTPIHDALEWIGQIKANWGWKFSIISTGIFGGLLPALIPWLLRQKSKLSVEFAVASTILWAYKGFEIDMFYHLQAWMFGADANLQTVVAKVVCDQLIWVPAMGMVNVVLFYFWRECGYSFRVFFQRLGKNWYSKRVLPVLIANWVIWIPAVAMIYCLPTALQLPVQNLILCFWVLILTMFTETQE